jgi:hypothetical protein
MPDPPTSAPVEDAAQVSWMDSITPASLAAAVPDLTMGAVCLMTWIWAERMPPWIVRYILLVMLLEFIVIHSSAILGSVAFSGDPRAKKLRTVLSLGAMYSLFGLGFCLAFKTVWPLISFWGQTANRLSGAMYGPGLSERQRQYTQGMWGIGAMIYLVGAFLSSLLPIPRWGITAAVERAADLPGSGLWIDDPWRPVVFGFLYFTGVGLFDLFQERWVSHVKPKRT